MVKPEGFEILFLSCFIQANFLIGRNRFFGIQISIRFAINSMSFMREFSLKMILWHILILLSHKITKYLSILMNNLYTYITGMIYNLLHYCYHTVCSNSFTCLNLPKVNTTTQINSINILNPC